RQQVLSVLATAIAQVEPDDGVHRVELRLPDHVEIAAFAAFQDVGGKVAARADLQGVHIQGIAVDIAGDQVIQFIPGARQRQCAATSGGADQRRTGRLVAAERYELERIVMFVVDVSGQGSGKLLGDRARLDTDLDS